MSPHCSTTRVVDENNATASRTSHSAGDGGEKKMKSVKNEGCVEIESCIANFQFSATNFD